MPRVIIITTSHDELSTNSKTGVWLEELATPYYILKEARYEVDIASIKGGKIPLDPNSITEESMNEDCKRFLKDQVAKEKIENSIPIHKIYSKDYKGVFIPGGHGTMWDFPHQTNLGLCIASCIQIDKPVALVCHGPAALVGVKIDNKPVIKGKKLTCFSNSEEEAVGLTQAMPFSLENKLVELGAEYSCGEDFASNVVVDGPLLTGQNPASSKELAERFVSELLKRKSKTA